MPCHHCAAATTASQRRSCCAAFSKPAKLSAVCRDVLGDRRRSFTWSGSIIDSVVGAFLTQAGPA